MRQCFSKTQKCTERPGKVHKGPKRLQKTKKGPVRHRKLKKFLNTSESDVPSKLYLHIKASMVLPNTLTKSMNKVAYLTEYFMST